MARPRSNLAGWLLPAAGVLLALALLWATHDTPRQPLPWLRLDGLSVFFILLTLAGLAPGQPAIRRGRQLLALSSALVAYSITATPAIVLAYLVLALSLRQALLPAWLCLLVGYGALALGGALAYNERTAGAALSSLVFWFCLLAAIVPQLPLVLGRDLPVVWRLAWCYPLVRLYSLGPWNSGWMLATLLFGGAAALWATSAALTAHTPAARARALGLSSLALALAGFGLGSSAGLAAGCYGLLVALLLERAAPPDPTEQPALLLARLLEQPSTSAPDAFGRLTGWLLTGAVPFTAPFVATWMLVGAAAAGGLLALAALVWLVAMLNALALALGGLRQPPRTVALVSVALGTGAPLVLRWLIEPVIEQLQGGLTPFGDVVIWPWVGLALRNSGSMQVAALPSLAVAVLMLVLAALVYLAARLYGTASPGALPPLGNLPGEPLAQFLRREVPWLAGAPPQEADPRDRE